MSQEDRNSEFWKKVRAKSSYNTDENGNKIPEVRPLEELIEEMKKDPKAYLTFNKQERKLFEEDVAKQFDEFTKRPLKDKEYIIAQTVKAALSDPNLTAADRETIKQINAEFLAKIRKDHKPEYDENPSMLDLMKEEQESWMQEAKSSDIDDLISKYSNDEIDDRFTEDSYEMPETVIEAKPEETINVDDFLAEVYGTEVEVVKEYKKKDYQVELDGPFVKFHVNGVVPPMTNIVFKDIISKLELTYHDNGFWKFPRTDAELKYWLKEEKII
jgi:hypothetical protein